MNLDCHKFGNRAYSTFSNRWNDTKLPFVANPSNDRFQPKADPRSLGRVLDRRLQEGWRAEVRRGVHQGLLCR